MLKAYEFQILICQITRNRIWMANKYDDNLERKITKNQSLK